jgi:hypothetical protein
MINRDLMQRQMFRNGGGVVPMQDGGEPTFKEKILAVSRGVVRWQEAVRLLYLRLFKTRLLL